MKIVFIFILTIILAGAAYMFFLAPTTTPPTQSTNQEPAPVNVTYQCNEGKTIAASYHEGTATPAVTQGQPPQPTGSVALVLSDGRTLTLPQTISADGTRYANSDESFIFWGKGRGALVLEGNVAKSYSGCIEVAADPGSLGTIYHSDQNSFTLRYPTDFTKNETYTYNALGPDKAISGVSFTIPATMATGSNLAPDTYLSVESLQSSSTCDAAQFLADSATSTTILEGDTTYSRASTIGAAAGNRYEETVYALANTNPCLAVRYFVHYGVFENYPEGNITEFNKAALLASFDAIRHSLIVNQ